jgi:hypothetical protein
VSHSQPKTIGWPEIADRWLLFPRPSAASRVLSDSRPKSMDWPRRPFRRGLCTTCVTLNSMRHTSTTYMSRLQCDRFRQRTVRCGAESIRYRKRLCHCEKTTFQRCECASTSTCAVAKYSSKVSGMPLLRRLVSCAATAATIVMGAVLLARRGDRWHRSQPSLPQVGTVDPRRRDRETFGDYLQSRVDEHSLLRREY